jgi:hypothetical protein
MVMECIVYGVPSWVYIYRDGWSYGVMIFQPEWLQLLAVQFNAHSIVKIKQTKPIHIKPERNVPISGHI